MKAALVLSFGPDRRVPTLSPSKLTTDVKDRETRNRTPEPKVTDIGSRALYECPCGRTASVSKNVKRCWQVLYAVFTCAGLIDQQPLIAAAIR